MAHYLFSQELDIMICSFEEFNKDAIKKAIIGHLKQNPNDTVEHCKDFNASDIRKYYGYDILDFYEVNKANNKVSKVTKNYLNNKKPLYKSIE